jgi:hypothetical protein
MPANGKWDLTGRLKGYTIMFAMYTTSFNTINCYILPIDFNDKFLIVIRTDNSFFFHSIKDLVFVMKVQCVFVRYVLNC